MPLLVPTSLLLLLLLLLLLGLLLPFVVLVEYFLAIAGRGAGATVEHGTNNDEHKLVQYNYYQVSYYSMYCCCFRAYRHGTLVLLPSHRRRRAQRANMRFHSNPKGTSKIAIYPA